MSSYYEKMLATGEVKCIDEEIPFEIPATWNWARLSNITSILGDGIHGTPEYDATGTVYFINGNNLSNGSIEIKTDTKKVSEQEAEKHKRLLNSTTVLVSINGTLGNVAFYNGENVILGKSVCYFNLMGNIDKQYIKHILETEYFTEYAKNVATGSTIKNVPLAGMRNFLIPVPPITEQHRIILGMVRLAHSIVRYNDAQTKLYLLNNALNEKLKKSVLQEAIQGKLVPQLAEEGTAQELLEQIKAEKEKLVKEGKLKKSALNNSVIFRGDDNKYYTSKNKDTICIDDEIPFEIPDSWVWVRFGTIMINRDRERIPLSVAQRQFLSKRYDYYGASGVIDKVDRYLFDKELLLIGEDGANLLNRSTPIAFIAKGKYWVNNHAHVLDVYDGVLLKYIALYINSISLVPYVTGTAQPKMNQEKMNSILIALPPQKEQQRIVAQIEKLFEQLH